MACTQLTKFELYQFCEKFRSDLKSAKAKP